MSVKVAINGFGRIGRLAFRQMFGADGYEVVADVYKRQVCAPPRDEYTELSDRIIPQGYVSSGRIVVIPSGALLSEFSSNSG